MTIAWIYLDKKAAAISALKDYASMKCIIRNYLDDAREARAHLTGIHMPLLTGTPGKANPRAPEAKMAATLDVIDVVEERYQQALEYMAWFRPAWEALTVEARHILSEFFLHDERTRADTLSSLCAELGYEKSAVYNRKDKALSHLALLLYGK